MKRLKLGWANWASVENQMGQAEKGREGKEIGLLARFGLKPFFFY
jgi:hypothetical protein